MLLAGLATFLAGTGVCATAWSLPVLIGSRVVEALGGCAGMVLGRAIVRDLFDRERSASALATITMAMSLAPSISPVSGLPERMDRMARQFRASRRARARQCWS